MTINIKDCLEHDGGPCRNEELIEALVAALTKLKKLLGPEGEYSITRSDGKKIFIGDFFEVGDVFEEADTALADARGATPC